MAEHDDRAIRRASVAFVAGLVIHNIDHGRRGLEVITDHVVWGGTIVAMVAAVVLTLVATRHLLAPFAATAAGLSIAFGVTASHLLPQWSAFSDPLPGGDVDALTWLAVAAEVAGALVLGLAGFQAVRRQGFLLPRQLRDAPAR